MSRCSEDLRRRVVKYVRQGGSQADASRRYEVSLSSIYRWLSKGEDLKAGKPGPKGGWRLDRTALLKAVEARPDAMLKELAEEFGVGINTVHHALKKLGVSRKKNGALCRGQTL